MEVQSNSQWLLLIHQLPAEPSRIRVAVWRRLQSVGAVSVKNSVYVLPNFSETREDFEWIRGEIVSQGGEAMTLLAKTFDEATSAEIRDAFLRARRGDWRELRQGCVEALAAHAAPAAPEEDPMSELRRQARSLRARADRLDKIDYFHAAGRSEAMAALERIERLIEPEREVAPEGTPRKDVEQYRGRTWLTRPRPGVDRMASAWLIRRFIDPQARFLFNENIPQDGEVVPFDMFGVEFGHQGERVTFETLLTEFGLRESALSRIARIVRELDLRVEPPSDAEAPTVDRLVEGLRTSFDDDQRLLDHGAALFEALYASFSGAAGGVAG